MGYQGRDDSARIAALPKGPSHWNWNSKPSVLTRECFTREDVSLLDGILSRRIAEMA